MINYWEGASWVTYSCGHTFLLSLWGGEKGQTLLGINKSLKRF